MAACTGGLPGTIPGRRALVRIAPPVSVLAYRRAYSTVHGAWIEAAGLPVGELVPVHSYQPILTIGNPQQEQLCTSLTTSSPRPLI